MNNEEEIPHAGSPHHAFWIFREGERTYKDYWDLLGRRDAPVRISDDVLRYFYDSLQWIPSSMGYGLNYYGPTVLSRESGEIMRNICLGWVRILSQAPEIPVLTSGMVQVSSGDESNWQSYRFRISRDETVQALEKLAEYGRLIATGDYFMFHLGI